MRNLYKRIVTIGMISFSAILAWVYCILVYRAQPAYVIGVSLVAVASLYAFLLALVDLKMKRDEKQQLFVSQTMQNFIEKQNNTEEFIALERLLKASYSQHRKTNERLKELTEDAIRIAEERADGDKAITELLQKQLVEALNKAVKVTLKYNQNNNDKMLSATREIASFVTEISSDVEKLTRDLEALYAEVHALEFPSVIEVPGGSSSQTATDTSPKATLEDVDTDIDDTSTTMDLADVIPFPVAEEQPVVEEAFVEEAVAEEAVAEEAVAEALIEEEPVVEAPVEAEPVEEAPIEEATASAPENLDPNRVLSPEDIAALFASAGNSNASTEEPVEEEPIEEAPVAEAPVEEATASAPENLDPNRVLSPEDIAALFASAGNSNASTTEPVEKEPVSEAPIEEAPIEEAPVEEAPVATAPVATAPDPNRMLSPDEIAALFASAGNSNASTEETVVEEPIEEASVEEAPVAVAPDPNRMLSPDEIAALFASAGNSNASTEETVVEEPIEEAPVEEAPVATAPDPNRMLSPDEIAALFASAGN